MAGIFVSYRRADSEAWAGRLQDRLVERFGSDQVFFDIESIPPGADFREFIREQLDDMKAVLVVIGPQWATITDSEGVQRLSAGDDLVRQEVEIALQMDKKVVPVLVGGAAMPDREDLPAPVADLAGRNAVEVSTTRFDYDVDRLMLSIADDVPPVQRPARRWRYLAWAGVLVLGVIAVGSILAWNRSESDGAPTTLAGGTTGSVATPLSSPPASNGDGGPGDSPTVTPQPAATTQTTEATEPFTVEDVRPSTQEPGLLQLDVAVRGGAESVVVTEVSVDEIFLIEGCGGSDSHELALLPEAALVVDRAGDEVLIVPQTESGGAGVVEIAAKVTNIAGCLNRATVVFRPQMSVDPGAIGQLRLVIPTSFTITEVELIPIDPDEGYQGDGFTVGETFDLLTDYDELEYEFPSNEDFVLAVSVTTSDGSCDRFLVDLREPPYRRLAADREVLFLDLVETGTGPLGCSE